MFSANDEASAFLGVLGFVGEPLLSVSKYRDAILDFVGEDIKPMKV